MEDRRRKDIYQEISQQKELIATIFSKWWNLEEITSEDKANYYHAKVIVTARRMEKLKYVSQKAQRKYSAHNEDRVSKEVLDWIATRGF